MVCLAGAIFVIRGIGGVAASVQLQACIGISGWPFSGVALSTRGVGVVWVSVVSWSECSRLESLGAARCGLLLVFSAGAFEGWVFYATEAFSGDVGSAVNMRSVCQSVGFSICTRGFSVEVIFVLLFGRLDLRVIETGFLSILLILVGVGLGPGEDGYPSFIHLRFVAYAAGGFVVGILGYVVLCDPCGPRVIHVRDRSKMSLRFNGGGSDSLNGGYRHRVADEPQYVFIIFWPPNIVDREPLYPGDFPCS